MNWTQAQLLASQLANDIDKGEGKNDDIPSNLRLFNCESLGNAFQITTQPLSSFEILQLQWLLHRDHALTAAAGYCDYNYNHNDDDDDGDAYATVEEVEMFSEPEGDVWFGVEFDTPTSGSWEQQI